ncbi:MAG: glycosyltransferase [Acidothermaceae bacterium]
MTSVTRHDHLVRPRHVVTAVLVAHDGARWLPATLHAIKTQRRPVQRFVAVDTGSRDETRELLERAAGATSVLAAPRNSGFGAAVQQAVAAFAGAPGLASTRSDSGAPVEWIWLLHDDSAPSSTALELMLELADEMPSAAVIGPKLLGWDNHRVLVEFGVTVDRGGRRETGLEPGELDHGQHDGDKDVLAVSTAGMLVRRDVWEELRGLDPGLPLFRDDLDFGWRANLAAHRVVVCTRAVVYHAEAVSSGARRIDAATSYRRRLDRYAALRTMLVNAQRLWFPWVALRLLLASLLRALVFVVIKRPFDAWDEIVALISVFARPRAMIAARSARKKIRRVPARDVRRLLAPRGTRARHYADAVSQRLALIGTGGTGTDGTGTDSTGAAADTNAVNRGLARRIVTQPAVALVVALLIVALIAERHVLGGSLYGGALLPAPSGATDLWRTYTQSWHLTGFGSSAVAPPYLAILAILSSILFGSATFAVQVLMLGSVPLAGLSAYLAVRPIAPATRVRLWVAATYALLPVVTGSVSSGRLGPLVVVMVLPIVISSAVRALLPPLARGALVTRSAVRRAGRRWQGARPAWAASIPLAVAAAFDPMAYVLIGSLVAVALGYALVRRAWLAARRAVVLLVVPPVLLLPWTIRLWHHPALIVTGVGQTAPGLQSPKLPAVDVLLLHPGGAGLPPFWLFAVVVLAGFAGLLQLTRPGPARLGWLLAIAGLVGGLVVSHLRLRVPGAGEAVAGWPGTATAVMAAGVLMAAAVAGARMRARLATTSFGWRQPVSLLVTAAAVATPVAAAGIWLAHGTGSLLHAGNAEILPAFITDPTTSHDGPRTIVLRPSPSASGGISYSLLRARSPRLGDADLPPDPRQVALADAAVGDLAGGFGQNAATTLAHLGVRYVLVPQADDAGVGARIAAAGGLLPKATDSGWQVWQVEADAGRLMLAGVGENAWKIPSALAGPGSADSDASANTDASGSADSSGTGSSGGADTAGSAPAGPSSIGIGRHSKPLILPYSPTARSLVLAEAPSPSWRAIAVGADDKTAITLAPTTRDGMQAFAIPTAGANVVVFRQPGNRTGWLVFELLATLAVLGAAIPAGRRAADQQRHLRRAGASRPAGSPATLDAVGVRS